MKNKKRKIICSVISLMLCITMLLGTTLAWFTSTVSVTANGLLAGKLKIDFQKYNVNNTSATAAGKYESLRDSEENIFSDGENTLYWRPGQTEILYLAVKNLETLSVKYNILLSVSGIETGEVFEYAILDGVVAETEEAALLNNAESWDDITAIDGVQSGKIDAANIVAAPNGMLGSQGATDYFALAVHMDEDAGNQYQGKKITIDVQVNAVQSDGELEGGPNLGSMIWVKEDFETKGAGTALTYFELGNRVAIQDEADGNTYMLMERTVENAMHVNASRIASYSDYVVYEFDLKVFDLAQSGFSFYMTDMKEDDPVEFYAGALLKDGIWVFGDKTQMQLEQDTWYSIGIAIDYYTRTVTYYFEDEIVSTDKLPTNFAIEGDWTTAESVRWHVNTWTPLGNMGVTFNDKSKIGIDNVRIYDAKEPLEELGDIQKVIELTDESVFEDQTPYANALRGYMAVHKRSGVVFVNGKKSLLPTLPYAKDDETIIQTAELAELLGIELPAGTAAEMDVEAFFTSVLNKKVYTDDTTISSGMVIAGDTVYAAPEGEEELQKLNDYLFYLRPSAEELIELYQESGMANVHPRIQATQADFDRIRTAYQQNSNAYITEWVNELLKEAELLAAEPTVIYEFRSLGVLLEVCRDVLNKMYTFGMAYQITGDKKYADRAYQDLEAVSNFYNWHPQHALDIGELAAAVAIGYDWMYHAFTEEQRAVIEKGLYNNAFYDAIDMYQGEFTYMYALSYGEDNWCTVVSGGLAMAALAMMDVYPEVASNVLQHAIKASDNYLFHMAPEGAWYEGPHYWEYVAQYLTKMLSSMETALGTDLSLGTAEGVSTTATYVINLQGDQGIFTYGDGVTAKIYVPEMMYLGNKYDDVVPQTVVLNKTGGTMIDGTDLALALLWYDTDITATNVELPLDSYYEGDAVVAMHDTFAEGETTFVAYHAGDNSLSHGHLDAGSFVFDSDGVRWAKELGMGNYSTEGYWDETDGGVRWNIFRMRAEAHNTLVINPDGEQDQEFNSYSPITKFESKPRGTIVLSDLTEAYVDDANFVKRGLAFTDNRRSLVIRDEIDLKADGSDVYWFMLTDSAVNIADDGQSAILTQNGKQMQLEFVSNQTGTITCATAAPLITEGIIYQPKESAKRIAIEFTDAKAGELNITVKLTPYGTVADPAQVTDYDKNMAEWTIADGIIPTAPVLENLKVNGEDMIVEGLTNVYYYVEGTLTEVPEIVATCSTAYVEQTGSLDAGVKIVLTDKADATNKATYLINFKAVPAPQQFEGKTSIQSYSSVANLEPEPANIAANVIDGDLNTRWSAKLVDGVSPELILDLMRVQEISGMAMAFWSDDGRQYYLTFSVSTDGINYEKVCDRTSAGSIKEYEFLEFDKNVNARYIKITSTGNSKNTLWTSILEAIAYKNN
ncbi:MAG: discoidin domain-containing protein [Lachnospiraceae bacterium]|nr:discoidin domain-containing protein [Lachnospiraceae bacterium]